MHRACTQYSHFKFFLLICLQPTHGFSSLSIFLYFSSQRRQCIFFCLFSNLAVSTPGWGRRVEEEDETRSKEGAGKGVVGVDSIVATLVTSERAVKSVERYFWNLATSKNLTNNKSLVVFSANLLHVLRGLW